LTALALQLPQGLSADSSWWYHEDPAGIGESAAAAMTRSLNATGWKADALDMRVRDLRSLLVARSWVSARLAGTAGRETEGGPLVIQPTFPGGEMTDRAQAVATLGATPLALAMGIPGFNLWTPPRLMVTGRKTETTFPPLIVAAVVAIEAVAYSAAIAYVANQAAQVIDNFIARRQAAQEMMRADAMAVTVLDKHVAREQDAGKALPLDDASRQVLASLAERQKILATSTARPPVESHMPTMPEWGWPAVAIGGFVVLATALHYR
jgi:hypothetical protein